MSMNKQAIDKLAELLNDSYVDKSGNQIADEFFLESKANKDVPDPVEVTPDNRLVYKQHDFDESIFEEASKILGKLNDEEVDDMGILDQFITDAKEPEGTEKPSNDKKKIIVNVKSGKQHDETEKDLDEALQMLQSDLDNANLDDTPQDTNEPDNGSDNSGDENVEDNEDEAEVQRLDDGTILVIINGKKYVCKPEGDEEPVPADNGDNAPSDNGDENVSADENVEEAFRLDSPDLSEDLDNMIHENFDLSLVEDDSDFDSDFQKLVESLDFK